MTSSWFYSSSSWRKIWILCYEGDGEGSYCGRLGTWHFVVFFLSGSTSNNAPLNDWMTVNNHFGRKCYSAGVRYRTYWRHHEVKKWRQEVPPRRLSPSTRLYGGVVHEVATRKANAVTVKRDAGSTEKGGEYNKYELYLISRLWSSGMWRRVVS